MAQLQDTDLMLVNRGGKSYKATGAEIKDSLNPTVVTKPQIIAPANGAGIAIGAESDVIIDAYGTADSNTYKWTELTFGTNSQISPDGLTVTKISGNTRAIVRGFGPTSGKWYYEARMLSSGTSLGASFTVGWGPVSQNDSQYLCSLNNVYAGPGNTQSPTYTGTQTDWIAMCAIDVDAGLVWYGANGQWHKNENPADGVNTYWTWQKPDPSDPWVMKNDHSYNGTGSVEIQTSPQYKPNGFNGNLALVLASNKGLTGDPSFAEGDPVQQDSGHTPTTSAITNVIPETVITGYSHATYTQVPTFGETFTLNLTTEWASNTARATNDSFGSPAAYAIVSVNGANTSVTLKCGTSGGSAYGSNDLINWVKLSYIGPATSREVTETGFLYYTFDGRLDGSAGFWVKEAKTLPILTLKDDTDLENFRVGDIVGISAPADGGGGTAGTGNAIYYVTGVEADYPGINYQVPNNPGAMVKSPWDSGARTENTSPNYWQKPYRIILDPPMSVTSQIKIKPAGSSFAWLYLNGETGKRVYFSAPRDDQEQNTPPPGASYASSMITITPEYFEGDAVISQITFGADKDSPSQTAVYGMEIDGTPYYAAIGDAIKVTAIGPGNTLTVDGGTWSNGEIVTGPNTTPATGTIASTDSGTNTMVLATSDETYPKRWIVNQGKHVIGEQFPSMIAAPDADGLTLIATDFVDSPYGSLTHGSSDWQVTTYNDTSYSAPVASATGDATNKTTWEVTPTLEEGTRYRARVRYKASQLGQAPSPWSDDTTFQTYDP